MALNKTGSPTKLSVIKQSAFEVDINMLASLLLDQWQTQTISLNQLHEGLKSLGIINYSAEDMQELVGRLQAIGFTIK
jgi:hypothetical protein